MDISLYVRGKLTESFKTNRPLYNVVMEDKNLKPYLEKLTDWQKEIISNPSKYTGIASEKTEKIINLWEKLLKDTGL